MTDKPEIYTKSLNSLISLIKDSGQVVALGGKTSTVIPYQKEQIFGEGITIINLSQLPKEMEITGEGHLRVKGPVDWREAREFCSSHGREILTAPTEDTAHILLAATSATGERCLVLVPLGTKLFH